MGGVSRGMRGTGGRIILVRIPWMPHMGRETQIAARGGLKTARPDTPGEGGVGILW